MTVVLDTSVLVAFLHAGDPHHAAAQDILRRVLGGEHGVPIANEHVLDEGLTLLRRRPGREDVSRRYAAMFYGDADLTPFLRLQTSDADATRRALALHLQRFERGLSFTDCTLAVLATDLGCPVASFDAHFDGIVDRMSR